MSKAVECKNCSILSKQCLDLKEEIRLITTRLDNLIEFACRKLSHVSCQTDDDLLLNFNQHIKSVVNSACQTTVVTQSSSVTQTNAVVAQSSSGTQTNNTQPQLSFDKMVPESSDLHGDISSGIFMNTYQGPIENANISSSNTLPCTFLSNQPFSHFDLNLLDKELNFDRILGNRSVCYFGNMPYYYSNVIHQPKPIPGSNEYLNQILNHLSHVLPDFNFNSILITKYQNGSEWIGFHSDNEPEIEKDSQIVTISLGETRIAEFRPFPDYPDSLEQSAFIRHGDVFIMSRASQDVFQHSIRKDKSQFPRISITLRLLYPSSTHPFAEPVPNINAQGAKEINTNPIPGQGYESLVISESAPFSKDLTLYISDSMFRGIDSDKMSSQSQEAIVLTFPGATAGGLIGRLKSDPTFNNLDLAKVTKCYLLCGGNNVDNILNVPKNMHAGLVMDKYISEISLERTKQEISDLTNFIHSLCRNTTVNVLNILPRQSLIRNKVINILNYHINKLCESRSFVFLVATEIHRKLFSNIDGHRKSNYFSYKGSDNIHLNHVGIVRLAKYMKFHAHHGYIE